MFFPKATVGGVLTSIQPIQTLCLSKRWQDQKRSLLKNLKLHVAVIVYVLHFNMQWVLKT